MRSDAKHFPTLSPYPTPKTASSPKHPDSIPPHPSLQSGLDFRPVHTSKPPLRPVADIPEGPSFQTTVAAWWKEHVGSVEPPANNSRDDPCQMLHRPSRALWWQVSQLARRQAWGCRTDASSTVFFYLQAMDPSRQGSRPPRLDSGQHHRSSKPPPFMAPAITPASKG
jgi:hypothetical protein